MPLVTQWTGREIRALRVALRMSQEAFAERLGISDRMVSKWEGKGSDITPHLANQAALDRMLAEGTADVHGRFIGLLGTNEGAIPGQVVEPHTPPAAAIEHLRHPTDGKLMAKIPAGIYLSGTDFEPVWVEEYYIDVAPVTNADYSRFVAATGHTPPRHWESGRSAKALYDHPVVWVTWKDATAYAHWAGKELPTSEQWEKAARGASGARYPWGDQETTAKCNVRESQTGGTTSVSRYHSGVSPYGVYDLCGNTWEWLSTETVPGRYELKGSAWTSPFFRALPSAYNDAASDMLDDDTGFRCVALPGLGQAE